MAVPGLVVSDYTADMELIAHGYAADARDATLKAFTAGLDQSMQSGFYADHLPALVADGQVPMAMLDDAVRRVLWTKEAIGLFDQPYRSLDPAREADASHDAEHAALARDAARRSIVLLKNDGPLLPLRKHGQKIALIGPFARDTANVEGPWTLFGDPDRRVSLEAGLRAAMGEGAELAVVDGSGFETAIDAGIEAAVAARAADVVLLAIGEPQRFSGEAQSRASTPAAQQALAEAVAATGTPVVVLLRNGRALALEGAVREAQAILVTWFLGSQNGHAIADVVFGDYNPSARLPVSFPMAPGQQPFFYNHPRTGRPELPDMKEFKARWREIPNAALYPFGHGLSYSTFAYGTPRLSTARLDWDATLAVTVTVANTGKRAGEEVVQLYVHDRVASRVRPVRELKNFQKILLEPGQSAEVEFTLDRHALAFTGVDGVSRPSRACSTCGSRPRARPARRCSSSCCLPDAVETDMSETTSSAPLYQLRIYEVAADRREAFHARFRDHAMRIMARYGFEIAALWESTTVTDFELVYLPRWPDADTMERRWREFLADAEWIDIKRRMDEDIGEPVRKVTSRVLDALPYSPQPHAA
jgi:beta-glucosidase